MISGEDARKDLESQAPGVESGWVFPSETGTLRTPGGFWKAWRACLKESKVAERFTIQGLLRRTFNDLTRRAGVDGVVIKSLTGHVTEKMRTHYSTVGLDEKLVALSSVHRLVRLESGDASGDANAAQKKTGKGRSS